MPRLLVEVLLRSRLKSLQIFSPYKATKAKISCKLLKKKKKKNCTSLLYSIFAFFPYYVLLVIDTETELYFISLSVVIDPIR